LDPRRFRPAFIRKIRAVETIKNYPHLIGEAKVRENRYCKNFREEFYPENQQ
jgi:hypothetical protein